MDEKRGNICQNEIHTSKETEKLISFSQRRTKGGLIGGGRRVKKKIKK